MVDKLIEKTGPTVQLESAALSKGEKTRERILDIAYGAIVEKGFAERFLAEDEGIIDTLEERSRELSDDPLQSLLIFLNLYAQMMDDMESIHPGCMVASVTYQERMFDPELKRMNVEYLLRMRSRFERWLKEISGKYTACSEYDEDALADHLTTIVEGAIVMSKALKDERLMGKQVRLFRNHLKLLFGV